MKIKEEVKLKLLSECQEKFHTVNLKNWITNCD